MFAYLRYFALIGLALVTACAFGLSYYFQTIKQAEILEVSSRQATATVGSYNNAVFSRYAQEIIGNPNSPYLPSFTDETKKFFQNQPIAKITFFSPDVTRLFFGSNAAYATSDGSSRITLFDLGKPLSGTTTSRMLRSSFMNGGEGAQTARTLIQIIVPIVASDTTKVLALAEIYMDVSAQWQKLKFIKYLIIGTMVGTYLILMSVLMITASRAESIITKQHEINLELIASAAQAEAQSRDKSQFLASVSHELRTPLNAIIGFSEIIKNEVKDKLETIYQDYVEDIYASGKHLLSLINDILDYSKAEAGKLQIEWAETDTTKVIRNSLRMVLPRAEAAQVTLGEDIPSHHLVIVTDAKKLKQVLLNLLSNAVKFTPAGGEVRCHAWNDVVSGDLMIQVKDTGIGIAPKDISRVMTPFGQVDSALSRKYEGTGLGLPLSKKFVESMGGIFTIESELNMGTSVMVRLPKAPPYWNTPAMQNLLNPKEEEPHVDASLDSFNPPVA